MLHRNLVALAAMLALALAFSTSAEAQFGATPIGTPLPALGQPSKDSVWVPTPDRVIYRMLQLADTTKDDLVVDLGSGDGRIPIMAAKRFGARGIGFELEENLVRYSIQSAKRQGVAGRARFVRGDLFEADISKATVIALYISPGVMTKLKPKLLELKPGVRVTSHQFTLDDWEPDETLRVEERLAYLWVVPAKVEGNWSLRAGDDRLTVRFEQRYQMLRGSAERGGATAQLIGAKLRGTEIQFTVFDRGGNPRRYRGRVEGNAMRGESSGDGIPALAWSAQRG
jgi:SAM-dependent methyltransferase